MAIKRYKVRYGQIIYNWGQWKKQPRYIILHRYSVNLNKSSYDDHSVVLQTGMLPSTDVKIMHNQYGDYILIPVSPYIRHQLDIIEEYVTLNMDIPTPLAQEWKARDDKDTPYRKKSHLPTGITLVHLL